MIFKCCKGHTCQHLHQNQFFSYFELKLSYAFLLVENCRPFCVVLLQQFHQHRKKYDRLKVWIIFISWLLGSDFWWWFSKYAVISCTIAWCPWMTPLSDQNLNQHWAAPNTSLTQCTEGWPRGFWVSWSHSRLKVVLAKFWGLLEQSNVVAE